MSKKKPVEVDAETIARQTKASDPKNTVWVSANAGSGKTHVLSQRVIRLLLDDVPPSRILCLTYTKTAAAEMVNRVFERLSAWTRLDDEALREAIVKIDGEKPSTTRLKKARNLFAQALETPGGLQIQTIHAFCTMILKRFPLEANIAGHFELLDDETDILYRQDAKKRLTIAAHRGGDEELASAFDLALEAAGDFGLDTLLDAVLSGAERGAIQAFLQAVQNGDIAGDALDRHLGFAHNATDASIIADAWPLRNMPEAMMRKLAQVSATAKLKTIQEFGLRLETVLLQSDDVARFAALQSLFLTSTGAARKASVVAKDPLLSVEPNLEISFSEGAIEVLNISDNIAKLGMLKLTGAAHILLRHISAIHTAMKREGGYLDYEDLIAATQSLLQRDAASAWVQYKLDQGIDHVLVDEAQDTSPRQWSIVNTLTSDFFAGETASKVNRTLFVVGDEKQSIYSFQGARPEVFVDTGRDKKRIVEQAGRSFEFVKFPLSFRSTPEVLKAVDHVFGDTFRRAGLVSDINDYIDHTTIRQNQHGHVEVWDLIAPEDTPDENHWTKAVDHAKAPAVMLAAEVGKAIYSLVGKKKNPATGKIVQAGDILVLVRKRDKFMHALSKELKDAGVPVAGADRLTLTSHIAILDLMAIARITLQPEDDLSLAALLRSPVFGITDDELTALASGRDGKISLFDQLKIFAQTHKKFQPFLGDLNRWRDEADFVPVYEFFARILGRDGVRAKLIGRLGEEASDIIDEFLSYALISEKSGLHGLQTFVETLSSAAPEIKREASAGRNEVRIMTVHGAKGLEAPYVFLIDPGSNPASSHRQSPLIAQALPMGNQTVDGFFWVPKKEFQNSSIAPQRERAKALQLAEYKRLLYVGMTRAEDVLIVCGYRGKRESSEATWVGMLREGLLGRDSTTAIEHPETKRPILVFKTGKSIFEADELVSEKSLEKLPLEPWLCEKLPAYRLPPRPLTPSGNGLSVDAQAEASTLSPVLLPTSDGANAAIERGSAIHRLLEVLPNFPQREREVAARRYLARKLGDSDVDLIIEKVLAILDDVRFAAAFNTSSRAEVSIGGTLHLGGETRTISGKIDRLAVSEGHVLIVDYKTNRPAPHRLNDVPVSHIAQLALYREVLKPLYPDKIVEAALIYTDGPHFITVDGSRLDAALEALTAS